MALFKSKRIKTKDDEDRSTSTEEQREIARRLLIEATELTEQMRFVLDALKNELDIDREAFEEQEAINALPRVGE